MDEQLPITRRQFHILLNQIQMTDDDLSRYFEEGEIVKLTVHKAAKTWHFHFKFKALLPYKVYAMFLSRLTNAFSHIAQVTCTIEINDPHISEELVQSYWSHCVEELQGISPQSSACFNSKTSAVWT